MTIQGTRQLNARLKALSGANLGKNVLDRLGKVVVAEAKRRVARKTGTTGRSIHISSQSPTRMTVTAGGAAVYLEYGTRAHVILPRNKRQLAWPATAAGRRLSGRARSALYTKKGAARLGGWAYAMRVHHPGTHKQPFMGPAVEAAVRQSGLKDVVIATWNAAA